MSMFALAPARPATVVAAGTWQPLPRDPEQPTTAVVGCPRCGAAAELEPTNHPINRHGQVVRPWSCPSRCGFSSELALHEWAAIELSETR